MLALIEQFPIVATVLAVLGSLVAVGEAITFIRPKNWYSDFTEKYRTKGWFEKIMDFLESFAPVKFEEGKVCVNLKKKDDA